MSNLCTPQGLATTGNQLRPAFICFRRRARRASRSSSSSAPAPSLSSWQGTMAWLWGQLWIDAKLPTKVTALDPDPHLWISSLRWLQPQPSAPMQQSSQHRNANDAEPLVLDSSNERPPTVQAQDSLSEPRIVLDSFIFREKCQPRINKPWLLVGVVTPKIK